MKKRVYIFGGAHKTATSFIQNTLYANQDVLKNLGIQIVSVGLKTDEPECGIRHLELTKELMHRGGPAMLWNKVRNEIENSDLPNSIIMHEGLVSPQIDPSLLPNILADFDVEVTICLRNPIDYLESKFREYVMRRKLMQEIGQYARSQRGFLNYPALVEKWQKAFGSKNVKVFKFEEIRADPIGLFVKNFLPIPVACNLKSLDAKINASPSNAMCLQRLIFNRLNWAGLRLTTSPKCSEIQHIYSSSVTGRLMRDDAILSVSHYFERLPENIYTGSVVPASVYANLNFDENFSDKEIRKMIADQLVRKT